MESGCVEVFCVNCGSASGCMVLEDEEILQCIQHWVAPRLIQAHHLVCTVCWSEARATAAANKLIIGQKCTLCNKTLPHRARSHQVVALRTDTQHQVNIKNIILERLIPLEIRASHIICHPCWQKADRAAKHFSMPSTSSTSSNQLKCVNCLIDVTRKRRHILNDETTLLQIQQQLAPQIVTAADYICDACHALFDNNSVVPEEQIRLVGHENICVKCGRSVTNLQHHFVHSEQNQHILNVVQNWIHPRESRPSDVICHGCFLAAEVAARSDADLLHDRAPPAARILLPNYIRCPDTHSRCIFPGCNSVFQHLVPYSIRVRLFSDHNYYIPPNCRICQFHLESQLWSILFEAENVHHTFTAQYIEDFCDLLKNDKVTLDFEAIDNIDDNMVWYWLGRTKRQFKELVAELPESQNCATALGAYLLKLRTGDPDERLANLMNISRSTFTRHINKGRDMMVANFVPHHLGLDHITRREVAERNLYIPNSLFGNPGSSPEDRKAIIIIMDGTYVYVQKSTNYKYQKKTYSLHKYRNLVKPFMLVCCDGHIIDVLGPYPATKSDADIIKEEFNDASNPLRRYFKEGDVFILDRGFRDSIQLLNNLNYSVHYPLSIEQGESQMTTVNANESRKVTLCRWVVEVVNGRFKRDYKLLRQEYCNKSSKNLMKDFEVAAALINRFHPVLVDREDARELVSIIQEKMFTNNTLADFVELNNLNRKRAQFHSLTVQRNNITEFPQIGYSDLILIPLGIYQIKQARSYYGEHVRQDGSYIIEVCREVDEELLESLGMSNNDNIWLLRGRRTIGCCAHVMTVIWYLGWARHQNSIVEPPAQFLDDILIDNIDDAE